jgi:hypothetical protein
MKDRQECKTVNQNVDLTMARKQHSLASVVVIAVMIEFSLSDSPLSNDKIKS